jgi:starch synthase (maltosyl-transferring)
MPAPSPNRWRRVVIEHLSPEIEGGRFAIKRVVGETVVVEADVFADGHDQVGCQILHGLDGSQLETAPMTPLGNDRWRGEFSVTELGRHHYTVEAWIDRFQTWRNSLAKKISAGQDVAVDLLSGAVLIEAAAARAQADHAELLRTWARRLRENRGQDGWRTIALEAELLELMGRYPERDLACRYDKQLVVIVDREKARFSSWYELFPRSCSPEAGRHGTFRDCEAMLPYIASMGFDVVYLPPIHPIGKSVRKGKNNSVNAAPTDVGSPWAIGSAEGGHKAIHPELGTLEDFRRFVTRARELDLTVALDIAFQVAPDHPYVNEHENWFRKRPDGTIQYAENPPKKYQDIYPFDFESEDWTGMWEELKSVFDYWIAQGVTIFRVDNPHTKAFPFWGWVIPAIKQEHPEVLFLSEAFTRPKIMYRLAKLGFSQSYTYFPWRNAKSETIAYLTELTQTPVREFLRPNQWPNTPDILTEFLQIGGRAVFSIRFLLASTLGSNYGIYGPAFELMEHVPVRRGSEEYLNSEKYEIRHWDLGRPESLRPLVARVNEIRKENPALQSDWSLKFHFSENDQLICYTKESEDRSNLILTVVNLDPHHTQSGFVTLPLDELQIPQDRAYEAEDLLTGARYLWNGARNYVELNPSNLPGHILKIHRRLKIESDFDYFL